MIEAATTVVKPAAGPDTASCDPLINDTIIPPTIPESRPAYNGAPDANAIPIHKGRATRKTEKPAGRSCFSKIKR